MELQCPIDDGRELGQKPQLSFLSIILASGPITLRNPP